MTTHPVMLERFEKMLKSKRALPEGKLVIYLPKCSHFSKHADSGGEKSSSGYINRSSFCRGIFQLLLEKVKHTQPKQ